MANESAALGRDMVFGLVDSILYERHSGLTPRIIGR